MADDWQKRLDDLKRRDEARAKARAKAKARPNRPRYGSLDNPVDVEHEERIAPIRESFQRLVRPVPILPLPGLDFPVRPWVIPDRRGVAPTDAPGRQQPPPLRPGVGPRAPPGPGAVVIDLDADDAPVKSSGRARREIRFGGLGVQDEVIDLEALVEDDKPASSGNRDGPKVRFAPPAPIKGVIDLDAPGGAKEGALRPILPLGKRTRRAPAGPANENIDIDAGEGPSSARPGAGDADSDIGRAAQERARQLERAILGDAAGGRGDTGAGPRAGRGGVQVHSIRPIPQRFEQLLQLRFSEGTEGLSQEVMDYYRNEMMRRDSRNVAGHFGQPSLVEEVLREDALERLRGREGPGWRPVRELGAGGQGGVTLWKTIRPDGSVLQLATKDMEFGNFFFRDYNNEGNMTRRLNETGCENVLRVLEWAVLEQPKPRFRIAYEVAEYGDLDDLITFYILHQLILPEHFIWHVFHSLANALTYQALGHNESAEPLPEWEQIVHGDIKPANVLLCAPDPNAPSTPHAQYPALKLADYGCAFTIPLDRADVRAFKSTYSYGTPGYRAPEVKPSALEMFIQQVQGDGEDMDKPPYDQHGPHTDVWSLGATIQTMVQASKNAGDIKRPRQRLFQPYSTRLTQLIRVCQLRDGRARLRPYDLFVRTGRELREQREAFFEAGVRAAEGRGQDHGVYPDMVLFRKEDQGRFQNDMAYREAYQKVNLKYLYEQRPPPPPPPRRARGNDDAGPSGRGKKRDREESREV